MDGYGGCLALAPANPHDPHQHWLLHQAIKLKDRDSQPAFALVNRASKQAMQSPATKAQGLSWLSDTNLILTAIHDTVCDGTNLLLWPHNNRSNNQYWKIEPYDADILDNLKICCRSKPDYNLKPLLFG